MPKLYHKPGVVISSDNVRVASLLPWQRYISTNVLQAKQAIELYCHKQVIEARIDELKEFKYYYPEHATPETQNILDLHNSRIKLLEAQLKDIKGGDNE
jgi:hypothetical protein